MAAIASSLSDHAAWLRMDDASAVGAARRRAAELSAILEFNEDAAGVALVVVSEIASNLVKHAVAGDLLLRAGPPGPSRALEIVAADRGPGIADLQSALRDGTSTGGTLGVGLGAVARLSLSLDMYTDPSVGTVLAATCGDRPRPAAGAPGGTPDSHGAFGAVVRTYPGETVSGDGYAVREDGPVLSAMLCDGLGHGPFAERASHAALRAFLGAPFADAPQMLEEVHRSIGHTRGAAAAVVQTTSESDRLRFAGIGNISGVVDDGERAHALASLPGIVGHEMRRVAGFDCDAPIGSLVILHSDGLSPKWHLRAIPGIRGHSPLVIAAALLRLAGTRMDDASALAMRIR